EPLGAMHAREALCARSDDAKAARHQAQDAPPLTRAAGTDRVHLRTKAPVQPHQNVSWRFDVLSFAEWTVERPFALHPLNAPAFAGRCRGSLPVRLRSEWRARIAAGSGKYSTGFRGLKRNATSCGGCSGGPGHLAKLL